MKTTLRISIIILALLGFIGVSKISYIHYIGEESCPMIGILPACYLIFIAYAMVVVSMFPKIKKAKTVFIIGWLPIIVLALIGTVGEITQSMQCPRMDSGFPKCYLSAVFSIIIGILAWLFFNGRSSR